MKTIPRSLTGLLATILVTGLVFSSCKKHDDDSTGTSGKEEFATVTSESDAAAEVVFDDVFNNVLGVSSEVGIGGTGVFGRVDVSSGTTDPNTNRVEGVDSTTCYILTTKQLSTTRFPLQITIDFGGGCTGRDGR